MSDEQDGPQWADFRLFFLFNDGKEVRAYSSNVPNLNDDHVSLKMKGPYDLGSGYNSAALVSRFAAEPVFDSQALQVIYATNTKHEDREGKKIPLIHKDGSPTQYIVDSSPDSRSAISIWTVGRHATREKIEQTNLRGVSLEAQPSVLLAGGVMSAGALEYNPRLACPEYRLAQKQENGQYSIVTMEEDGHGFSGSRSKTFAGTLPKMDYVYNITPQRSDDGSWYDMRTIRTTNFKNLGKEAGLNWQASSFYPSFELGVMPAHAFSEDTVAKTPRLLFFNFRPNYDTIMVSWIKLRADGSPDGRSGTEIDCNADVYIDIDQPEPGIDREEQYPGEEREETHPGPRMSRKGNHNLNAFVYGKELLLIWATDEGFGGIMGELNDDGTVPQDWEWSTVTVTFDNAISGDASKYTFHGVSVTQDFIS